MRCGFVLPGAAPRQIVDQAVRAEAAGWDAVFLAEAAHIADPWVLLAAIAERTSTIRLGTMLTPLPWRRPWKVASQVATLDHLSGGRVTLAVGLGAAETSYGGPPDLPELRDRAAVMDEAIDLITAIWSGKPAHAGEHFAFDMSEGPLEPLLPVQQPRPPIWAVGVWPRMKSMRRVLRCDGIVSQPSSEGDIDEFETMTRWLGEQGVPAGFDVTHEGETPVADPSSWPDLVGPWRDAGATWWLESRWMSPEETDDRIDAGPPPG